MRESTPTVRVFTDARGARRREPVDMPASKLPAVVARKLPARIPATAAALTLALALVLGGCGSSAPTKSQYIAKAGAICATASTQTAPLIKQVTASAVALSTGGASAVARLASAVSQLHTVAASNLEKLQKLEQPSGDHAAIERFLTPFAGVVSAIDQAATALGKGQAQQALGLLEQIRPSAEQATSAAHAYGLTQCETVLSALA